MSNFQPVLNNPLDFSGSLLINEKHEKKDRYQIIYSSNSYGTDYSLYAKFNCQDIKGDDKNINANISFIIINYKGIVNIGFNAETDYGFDEISKSLEINLHVKGMELNYESNPDITIKLPRNSIIKVLVNRRIVPLSGKPVNINNKLSDCYNNGIFDSEFYYRDGNFHYTRKDFDKLSMVDSIKNNNPKPLKPGHRCRIGNNMAYIF